MPRQFSRVTSIALLLAIIALILPVTAPSTRAGLRQGQACETITATPPAGSGIARDTFTYANEVTLTNGAVVGFQDYWTEEADSTADIFRATVDDAVLLAGDYPAGTPLGMVWDDLCPVLGEMGAVILEQGTEPEGSIYALMITPNDDGSARHGVVRILFANGTDIPVFAILTAPAETFSVALGDADGVGVNGLRVFEDLDREALLATLQSGGGTSEETGQAADAQHATLGSGTVVAWSDPWGDPFLEPDSVNLVTADGTVLNLIAFPATTHTVESAAALTPEGQYTVFDSGPEAGGGFFQLSGQTIFDPMLGDERTFFVYARAWPSADGQWVIVAQLQSMTPFFTRDLASIPASITVDGAALWADVDPTALVATVVEAGVDMSAEEPAPAGNGESTGTTTSTTSTAPQSGASPRDILANVPVGRPSQGDEATGSYTSDQFGYTIEWADHWSVYEEWTEADADAGFDTYALETTGDGYAALNIHGAAWDDEYTVDDYVAFWESDDFLDEYQPDGTEVVLADASRRSGAVVLVGPASEDDDELWVTIYEIAVVDGELKLESSFVAPLSGFETAYEDAQASVTLDGDEVIGFFSTEEIVDELP